MQRHNGLVSTIFALIIASLVLPCVVVFAAVYDANGGLRKLSTRPDGSKNEVDAPLASTEFKGHDEVGHTPEAAALRHQQLLKKKRKGLLGRKQKSLAEVLFPGVAPELYTVDEEVVMMTDLVQSKKTVSSARRRLISS